MAVEPLPHLTPYRQLLAVAELRALLLATLLSRLAGRMFGLAIVLYGVTQVHSPVLAGCTWVGHQSDRGIADRPGGIGMGDRCRHDRERCVRGCGGGSGRGWLYE